MAIEVKVTGRGSARDDQVTVDPSVVAHCDLCDRDVELVVSLGPVHGCKECIRQRLDMTSIAAWQLRSAAAGSGLPWGKISG
jgi:hypothetical protein